MTTTTPARAPRKPRAVVAESPAAIVKRETAKAQREPRHIKTCEVCGKEYISIRSDSKHCSGRCSSVAWRNRSYAYRTLPCVKCGNPFRPMTSKTRYCSPECSQAAARESRQVRSLKESKNPGVGKGGATRGKELVPRRVCEGCGTRFRCDPSRLKRGGGAGRFCSNECRIHDMAMHPEQYPQTRTKRGLGGKRADLNGQFFRSSWEANYARYLNWLIQHNQIVAWEFEPDTYEFIRIKRGTRFYTPDFKITNLNGSIEYHEIKGYMDDRSRIKLDRMRRYFPDVKVILIDKDAYYALATTMRHIIPEWETQRYER